MHEFPLLERKCLVQCGSIPSKLLFLNQNNKFYAMFENKTVKGFKVICCSVSSFKNYSSIVENRSLMALLHFRIA